jgi:hypothetical protein
VCYSLDDIFVQATNDPTASPLHGNGYESYLLYGIKIIKDNETSKIELLNTAKSGDFYHPLNQEDMNLFHEGGWRYGIYVISLSNLRVKLDKIEQLIKKRMNEKPTSSEKQLAHYQATRQNTLERYTEITIKLNKLKSNQNGKTTERTNDI